MNDCRLCIEFQGIDIYSKYKCSYYDDVLNGDYEFYAWDAQSRGYRCAHYERDPERKEYIVGKGEVPPLPPTSKEPQTEEI